MIKQYARLWFFCVLLCGCFACDQTSDTTTLKLAHGLSTDHPVHLGMVYMSAQLEELSGGEMTLEIYPSQQLGTERQCLELLQIGSLDLTKVSAAVMENFSPRMKVFSLPYIFRDREHAYTVFDGPIGREVLESSEKYRLRGLTYFDAGQRSFYTKEQPIRSPDDLTGLKIRVQESPTAMAMVAALGGAPTPISWGELYTALQQGVVDGAENNPPSFFLSRHYEVCKYYSINEHTAVPDILVMGTHSWDALSAQEKEWLTAAATAATTEQRRLWQAAEKEALAAVQAEGVMVNYPTKAAFMTATEQLLTAYADDQVLYPLIQRIQGTKTKNSTHETTN
ncbi:MAG: TRAP transporter substrate-binding protein [Bacteroidota bacterium]